MKELSMEEKAKAYDEAIERARDVYTYYCDDREQLRKIEYIFHELKESEDEEVRKSLIGHLKECRNNTRSEVMLGEYAKWIAWLEKQGEKKPIMIQWQGNNLKEVIDFTGKDKNFEKWFKSFEEYEKYVHEHNDIFKLFNEDGSHYEVPVGAWIVKTPDGYNVASKAALKQKLADKVELKFKVGDWVVNNNGEPQFSKVIAHPWPNSFDSKIKRAENNLEIFLNTATLDKQYHLWTIQDAKDGDVLYTSSTASNEIFIFKGLTIEGYIECYCSYDSEDKYRDGKYHFIGKPTFMTHPATKEQRDLLFQKMKEAGYEWDAEKKELKKIEQKSVEWSEEDEKTIHLAYEFIRHHSIPIDSIGGIDCSVLIEKLKSLKDRVQHLTVTDEELAQAKKEAYNNALDKNEYHSGEPTFDDGWSAAIWYLKKRNAQPQTTWKPSDEQIDCLSDAVKRYNREGFSAITLTILLEQLRKLRKE